MDLHADIWIAKIFMCIQIKQTIHGSTNSIVPYVLPKQPGQEYLQLFWSFHIAKRLNGTDL